MVCYTNSQIFCTFALVIEIERHIEILLLSHDCVIVPGLGGFMAHHIDARYDTADGTFVPPLRTLGFNPQLTLNDSLLAQSYIETYDISYPEAMRRIEDEVAELRQHLETLGFYELNDVGVLRLNDEGKLLFEPCEAGILTPELYGLSSFAMKPLQAEPAADGPDTLSRPMPEEKAITIKMSWLRNAVAVAAAVVGFLMIGTPVSNSGKMGSTEQSAFINMPKHRAAAVEADEQPTVAKADEQVAEVPVPLDMEAHQATATEGTFCIVMASQVSQRNAERFVEQLKEKGYYDARIVVSAGRMRRVVYGSYETEADAVNTQRQLRAENKLFRETWVMEL